MSTTVQFIGNIARVRRSSKFDGFLSDVHFLQGTDMNSIRIWVDEKPVAGTVKKSMHMVVTIDGKVGTHIGNVMNVERDSAGIVVFTKDSKHYLPSTARVDVSESLVFESNNRGHVKGFLEIEEETRNISVEVVQTVRQNENPEIFTVNRTLVIKNNTSILLKNVLFYMSGAEPRKEYAFRGAAAMAAPSMRTEDVPMQGVVIDAGDIAPTGTTIKTVMTTEFAPEPVGIINVNKNMYDGKHSVNMEFDASGTEFLPGKLEMQNAQGIVMTSTRLDSRVDPKGTVKAGANSWLTYKVKRHEKRGRDGNIEELKFNIVVENNSMTNQKVWIEPEEGERYNDIEDGKRYSNAVVMEISLDPGEKRKIKLDKIF